MNKTFDWTRFGNLVRKDIFDSWNRFGITMLILALSPVAVWIFWSLINNMDYVCDIHPAFRWGMLWGVTQLTAILAPSAIYSSVNRSKEGIYFAMLPASKLEKYLSMLLVTVVICPLATLFGSIVVDMILTLIPFGPYSEWLFTEINIPITDLDPQLQQFLTLVFNPWLWLALLVASHLSSASTFIFTNTIFKTHKFWKTILWLWLISFALNIVTTPILTALLVKYDGSYWMARLDGCDPLVLTRWVMGISLGLSLAYSAVLLWWSGSRIKKMAY